MEKTKAKVEKAKSVVVEKTIKGAFGFRGRKYIETTFTLSNEDIEAPEIKRALEVGILRIK